MKKLIMIAIFIIISISIYATNTFALTGYDYYARVDIHNTGTQTYTIRIPVPINAYSLSNNNYIQADGGDITLGSGNICPTALSGTNAKWYLGYITLNPGVQTVKNIYFGNPSADIDHNWVGNEYDYAQAWDDASLDIDASTGIKLSANVTVNSIPNSGSKHYIMAKQGAYELYVDGTPAITFKVYDSGVVASPASGTVQADKTCMNDGITGTYCIRYDGVFNYDLLPPAIAPNGTEITSIEANLWMSDLGGVGGSTAQVQVSLIESDGSVSNSGLITYNGAGWVFKTSGITRYNNEPWTIYDFKSGNVGTIQFTLSTSGGANAPAVSEAWIKLNYGDSPGTACYVSIPIQEDINYDIFGEYSGGDVKLTVGATTNSGSGSFGNINTNTDYVTIGKFNGELNDCLISSGTPTYSTTVLNLDFEPDNISNDTITDQSTSNNDVEYWAAPISDDIDITVGAVSIYQPAIYVGSGTTTSNYTPVYWPDEVPNFQPPSPHGWDGIPGSHIINRWLDNSNIPRSAFWLSLWCGLLIGLTYVMFDKSRDVVGVGFVVVIIFCLQVGFKMGVGIIDVLMIGLFYVALYYRREISLGKL